MNRAQRAAAATRWAWREATPGVARRALLASHALMPLAAAAVGLGRAVDHLVAPGHRAQPIRAPIFIVGHPRSGTTWLHRLLALDSSFHTTKLWQAALPTITGQRALRHLPGRGRAAQALHDNLLAPMKIGHSWGWHLPEEDQLLLGLRYGAAHWTVATEPDAWTELWCLDALPAAQQRRWLRWYSGCVRRQLHTEGSSGTWLSKSPQFTGWLRGLAAAFPDARFVLLLRDPAEALASYLDQVHRMRVLLTGRPPSPDEIQALVQTSLGLWRHAEDVWPDLPPHNAQRVAFRDLVRDPEGVVVRLREGWGLHTSDSQRTDLAHAACQRPLPRSVMPLRRFGLQARDIRGALADLPELWRTIGRSP